MDVQAIIDRLYGLPLGEFIQARNEAVRELREAGQHDAAEEVKALRKPTALAAKVNMLVRERRAEVEDFLQAAAALREAQLSGSGDLDSALKRQRDMLERLVRSGGEAVRQTLLAAAVDDEAARLLLEGRLQKELEPRGFGALLAHLPATSSTIEAAPRGDAAPPRREAPPARAARTVDDSLARARLQAARNELRAAQATARRARRNWEQAEKNLRTAQEAVDKAKRDLEELRAG